MGTPSPGTRSFDVAADVAKQLIVLAAGIITITITFSKDFIGRDVNGVERLVIGVAWLLYLVSILGGIWLLYALAGSLSQMDKGVNRSIYDGNTAIPMGVQQIAFLLALVLTVVFGLLAM